MSQEVIYRATPALLSLLEEEAPIKPCPHKHTETIDFSHFTGKVYIRCKDCGIVLQGA